MSRITIGGIAATVLYISGVAWYLANSGHSVADLELNEFGDFLAGVLGPLAFFWLICGYLQQGVELRQNTEALNLQVKELQNSVAHQQELVTETRRQVDANIAEIDWNRREMRRRALPIFDATPGEAFSGDGGATVRVALTNAGGEIVGPIISCPDDINGLKSPLPAVWKRYETNTVAWDIEPDEDPQDFDFYMHYVDGEGNAGTITFNVNYYPISSALPVRFCTAIEVINPVIPKNSSRPTSP